MLFDGISKVMGMAAANLFNTNVVNDEAEKEMAPFVAPKDGSGGALVLAMIG